MIAIAFLLSEVLLQTSFLNVPYTIILRKVLPDVYGSAEDLKPHPYFASGLLFVLVTALLLFFASGMYGEKIAYANRLALHPMTPSLIFSDDTIDMFLMQTKLFGISTCT